MIAGVKCSPDSTPRIGGKIRLPAPKNMEKSIRPMAATVARLLPRDAPFSLVALLPVAGLLAMGDCSLIRFDEF